MKIRFHIGLIINDLSRFLSKLSNLSSTMMLLIMKPDDIENFNLGIYYLDKRIIKTYDKKTDRKFDLNRFENTIIEKYNPISGKILVIGSGTGRESIALSKRGCAVTGIDALEEYNSIAKRYAKEENLKIEFIKQNFREIDFTENRFDYALFSTRMYSSIPTRKNRIETLRRIKRVLKPKGLLFFDFKFDDRLDNSRLPFVKSLIASVTLGNKAFQQGDKLLRNKHFVHFFSSKEEMLDEITSAGFKAIELHIEEISDEYIDLNYAVVKNPDISALES